MTVKTSFLALLLALACSVAAPGQLHEPAIDAADVARAEPGTLPLGSGVSPEDALDPAAMLLEGPGPPENLTLDELDHTVTRAYDLSVSMAAQLGGR